MAETLTFPSEQIEETPQQLNGAVEPIEANGVGELPPVASVEPPNTPNIRRQELGDLAPMHEGPEKKMAAFNEDDERITLSLRTGRQEVEGTPAEAPSREGGQLVFGLSRDGFTIKNADHPAKLEADHPDFEKQIGMSWEGGKLIIRVGSEELGFTPEQLAGHELVIKYPDTPIGVKVVGLDGEHGQVTIQKWRQAPGEVWPSLEGLNGAVKAEATATGGEVAEANEERLPWYKKVLGRRSKTPRYGENEREGDRRKMAWLIDGIAILLVGISLTHEGRTAAGATHPGQELDQPTEPPITMPAEPVAPPVDYEFRRPSSPQGLDQEPGSPVTQEAPLPFVLPHEVGKDSGEAIGAAVPEIVKSEIGPVEPEDLPNTGGGGPKNNPAPPVPVEP